MQRIKKVTGIVTLFIFSGVSGIFLNESGMLLSKEKGKPVKASKTERATNTKGESTPNCRVEGSTIFIETSALSAQIETEGYVSGVASGTLVDKKTGARDLGHGLDIVDFLMEPGWDKDNTPEEFKYSRDIRYHGDLPKRYVELPQICTKAKKLPYKIIQGDDFVAVKLWYKWKSAAPGYNPGSLWEQYIVFPEGTRYFLSCDIVTSVNDVDQLILRIDMPGHLKHNKGENFEQVYLSYFGLISNQEFLENFPPHGRFLYQRDKQPLPERIIRGYQTKPDGIPGPFLAGMTLNPEIVYEGWCHQRDYICFIQEIGGYSVKAGDQFGAAYVVGYFDDVDDMNRVYDEYKGWNRIEFSPDFENARTYHGKR